jgi:protein tyrosine/serine phosphatase
MIDRLIPLEGVLNFRDFGGYPTACGRTVLRGKLYRSAHHSRATAADLEALSALGVAVIVDLRRAHERRREPSRRPAGFAGQVIENDIGDDEDDPWIAFMRESDLSAEAFRGYLIDYYRAAPFEPRHIDLYSRYFQTLAEAEGAVLIHCAAGKDRTGLLAALTHHLLGVSREHLLDDYLATNHALDFDRRLPRLIQDLAEQAGREPTPEAARLAMGVEAAYLHTAFAAIEDAHGDLDGYLTEALRVDTASRARIRSRLIG